jgi:predicted dehydrogenase
MMSTITIAFVGVAHIHTPGYIKRLNARIEAGEVTVKFVWDSDPDRGRRWAAEMSDAAFVEDPASIWSDPEITAVVIFAETNRHRDLVVAAAESGKHIFCQKPFGVGERDAMVMEQAVAKAGVQFQMAFRMRSNPVYQYIKSEVRAGRLGKLTRAHYSIGHSAVASGWLDSEYAWMADAEVSGGGALSDLGSHMLDLVLSTFGPTEGEVVSVKASLGNRVGRYGRRIDEYGTGLLTFASGFEATIQASWLEAGPLHLPAGVFGTEGQFLAWDRDLYYQSLNVAGMDGVSPLPSSMLPRRSPHVFEMFLDQLLGKPCTVAPVSVHEAALVSSILERLYADAGRISTDEGVPLTL